MSFCDGWLLDKPSPSVLCTKEIDFEHKVGCFQDGRFDVRPFNDLKTLTATAYVHIPIFYPQCSQTDSEGKSPPTSQPTTSMPPEQCPQSFQQ